MLENTHSYVKNRQILFKVILFVTGLITGSVLTYSSIRWLPDLTAMKEENKTTATSYDFNLLEKFDIPRNDRINKMIRFYLHPNRKTHLIESYLRSGKYLPMIRDIFEEYNLPQALVFLPILESAFLPDNISRAGAAGLWQIVPATASDYGLKYNSWIDERRDPEKSTVVAAEFLRYLYEEFQNWDLVLAAYNCGHNKLKRLMRIEKTTNFWELKRLPKETNNFVAKYYAILHILNSPEKYGLDLAEVSQQLEYETIDLEATFSVEQIAELSNVSPSVIKNYNPSLIGNIVPSGKYTIRVPVGVKEHFLEKYKTHPPERIELTYTTYRVRRGDTLYDIARKFGTTVTALKADNNIKRSRRIKPGQMLRVASVTLMEESIGETEDEMVNSAESSNINQVKFVFLVSMDSISIKTLALHYAVTAENIKTANPWLRSDSAEKGEEIIIYKPADKVIMHKIKRGDSLWQLARQYHSSVASLKRWNQLHSSRIHPGQQLIVQLK